MVLLARISTPPRITATVSRSTNALRVQTSGDASVNVALRKILIANSNLEELENVDPATYGLYNGFTLVYNAFTKTWQTQHITTVINENLEIDGGTY